MLPSILADQVRQGIIDFLETTFPVTSDTFAHVFERFLDAESDQMFKGPYASVQLPFRLGTVGTDFFPQIPLKFPPYRHQQLAFQRLLKRQSTIVATGTGSGKTECFLYPLLEHCRKTLGRPGIKAIVIYPMNALANDQAKRFAAEIAKTSALTGVRVGLYIGNDGSTASQREMSETQVITDHMALLSSPPDILLTNYKMLDLMLVRPRDAQIWAGNEPDTLSYLVVDELHTFDGAQGTDLACLIRRLKARLHTPGKQVTCIGTSATLGGGEGDRLRTYAKTIFDEPFDERAIITEDRLQPDEFFGESLISPSLTLPAEADYERLRPDLYGDQAEYVAAQYRLWFRDAGAAEFDPLDPAWRQMLGNGWGDNRDDGEPNYLKSHLFFRNLLAVLNRGQRSLDDLLEAFDRMDRGFRTAPRETKVWLILSLLSLISWARDAAGQPFLNVRVQLWMRELRRLVATMGPDPVLRFAADLTADESQATLPVVHCRDCGCMGWVGVSKKQDLQLTARLDDVYTAFFAESPTVHYLFPQESDQEADGLLKSKVCGECLHISRGDADSCDNCGNESLLEVLEHKPRIKFVRNGNTYYRSSNDCPFCSSARSLTIVGSRAASLISVANSVLFSSRYNDDKKLLAFSDSVQDAAHRAGFFTARTYRFNLRAALQQYLTSADRSGLSLATLGDAFCSATRSALGQGQWISQLLPPDMAWLDDYEAFVRDGVLQEGSNLEWLIRQRMDWEMFTEFSMRCRVGRTLEKTSCATLYVAGGEAAVTACLEPLQNEVGGLRELTADQLARFVAGMLLNMRQKGAVASPFLRAYVEAGGNTYLLTKNRQYMPGMGQRSRAPVFPTTQRSDRFEPLISGGTTLTWYQDWLVRCLGGLSPGLQNYANAVYEIVLQALVEAGILARFELGKEVLAWGIEPGRLQVSLDVRQLRCKRCKHAISVAGEDVALFDGAPCLRARCSGSFAIEVAGDNYYRTLYQEGDVQRIFSAEHTGLLTRQRREALEAEFMREERNPWDVNLLSCTPTLEMGINIGQLSSAVLCSIPPRQASYLQRIGRTGRRDGNSFNLAVANARAHDLFFYADPMEMMAGGVEPPGAFLNAPAVLERQLTAFAFDCWVRTGVAAREVPETLGKVLDAVARKQTKKFPFSFLDYWQLHRAEILDGFLQLFPETSEDCQTRLRTFALGGEDLQTDEFLDHRILNGFREVIDERASLKSRIQRIVKLIKQYEQGEARPQNWEEIVTDLETEKDALNQIARSIAGRRTYNFFTDEGLLPNYAFPEAGVVLRSVILKTRKLTGGSEDTSKKRGKYATTVYEYERAGPQAIREMAPRSFFYAEGRKVQVDQVEMRLAQLEEWRFCPSCSHMELVRNDAEESACPACGSTEWANEEQRRSMVRMRQVVATSWDRDSRISDDSDDRELEFYNRNLIVQPIDELPEAAYRLDCEELPFGFEYHRKVNFREVNFGRKDDGGETMCIAGHDVFKHAFEICRHCGQVQGLKRNRKTREPIRHAITCRHRHSDSDDDLFSCVFLYRDFQSEAIRILLPISAFTGAETVLQSFIAAIVLGLKLKFRGNIDHLQTTVQEDPIPGTAFTRKYLVLYDRVPGGTGYLKELMTVPTTLLEVFELALTQLVHCRCEQDADLDGCYRCVYAYRSSFEIPSISRKAAILALQQILLVRETLVKTDTVSTISQNRLIESELEGMFLEALRRARGKSGPARLRVDVVNHKPGYQLTIDDHVFLVEPQVDLTSSDGVALQCRPDFVLYPEKASLCRPIAVFMDGFAFHAEHQDGGSRVGDDFAKRTAILRSGRYWVWSLTWDDVKSVVEPGDKPTAYTSLLQSKGLRPLLKTWDKKTDVSALEGMERLGSFEMLVGFLACPDEQAWQCFAYLQACLQLTGSCSVESHAATVDMFEADDALQRGLQLPQAPGDDMVIGQQVVSYEDAVPAAAVLAATEQDCVNSPEEMQVSVRLFDDSAVAHRDAYKGTWRSVLQAMNAYQFLPKCRFVTTAGLQAGLYHGLDYPKPKPKGELSDEALELLDMIDDAPIAGDLIRACDAHGVPLPELECQLLNDSQGIVADFLLGWPEQKLACLIAEQDEVGQQSKLSAAGWTVVILEELSEDYCELMSLLKGDGK